MSRTPRTAAGGGRMMKWIWDHRRTWRSGTYTIRKYWHGTEFYYGASVGIERLYEGPDLKAAKEACRLHRLRENLRADFPRLQTTEAP